MMQKLLNVAFLAAFFLLLVDGILPQLQMALLGGIIIVKSLTLKLVLLVVVALTALLHFYRRGTVAFLRRLTLPSLLFVLYLVVHCVVSVGEHPSDYLLLSYNSYYFFLILLPLAIYLKVEPDQLNRWLVLVSIPLVILGLVQFVSNKPLLPLISADQSYKVYSVEYYGRTRAFSLFNSGLNYGHFLCLVGAFACHYLMRRRGIYRWAAMLTLPIIAIACYTTLTRNLYLEFAFTVMTALLLVRERRPGPKLAGFLAILPLLYAVVAIFIVFGVQLYVVPMFQDATVLGQESLSIRLVEWAYFLPLWAGQGLKTFLFGTGLIQSERFSMTEDVVIDNSFLAIGVHIGLIGLLLWIAVMWSLWLFLLRQQRRLPNNAFILAATAISSTWISSGVFSINFTLYPLLALVVAPLALRDNEHGQMHHKLNASSYTTATDGSEVTH